MAKIYLTFQQLKKKKTSYRSASHKNFIKDKNTGRVDIFGHIFIQKKSKKLKLKSQDPKSTIFEGFQLNLPKTTLSGPVTSLLNFFHFFQK